MSGYGSFDDTHTTIHPYSSILTMLLGALFGLSSAFVWSASSLLVKAQASRIDTLSFNAFRLLVGASFFFLLLPFFGGLEALLGMPPDAYLVLAVSVVFGLGAGDSIYFWSMIEIGASRAMPLSGIYPLFTWLLAVFVLDEQVTLTALAGTALILVSLYLLAPETPTAESNDFMIAAQADAPLEGARGVPPGPQPVASGIAPRARSKAPSAGESASQVDGGDVKPRRVVLGTAAALFAALLWAVSTTMLRAAMRDQANVVVVNAFRLLVGGVVLLPIVQQIKGIRAWRGYDRGALPTLILLAVFSTGIGSLLFVECVQFVGAARAALFNTTAPLIGVPLAVIFLHERVTRRVVFGTVLTVAGLWLVLL